MFERVVLIAKGKYEACPIICVSDGKSLGTISHSSEILK